MSADLYSRRLYWDGRKGTVRADGVTVELRSAPRLTLQDHCVEIDYAPEVRVAQIRDSAEAWREAGLFQRAADLAPYWEEAAHSLKGAARAVDLRDIEAICQGGSSHPHRSSGRAQLLQETSVRGGSGPDCWQSG